MCEQQEFRITVILSSIQNAQATCHPCLRSKYTYHQLGKNRWNEIQVTRSQRGAKWKQKMTRRNEQKKRNLPTERPAQNVIGWRKHLRNRRRLPRKKLRLRTQPRRSKRTRKKREIASTSSSTIWKTRCWKNTSQMRRRDRVQTSSMCLAGRACWRLCNLLWTSTHRLCATTNTRQRS